MQLVYIRNTALNSGLFFRIYLYIDSNSKLSFILFNVSSEPGLGISLTRERRLYAARPPPPPRASP